MWQMYLIVPLLVIIGLTRCYLNYTGLEEEDIKSMSGSEYGNHKNCLANGTDVPTW